MSLVFSETQNAAGEAWLLVHQTGEPGDLQWLLLTLDTHQEQLEDTSSATLEPYDSSLTVDTFQTSVSPAEACLILIKLSLIQNAT